MSLPAFRRACVLAAQLGTFAWLADAGLTLVGGTPVTAARAVGWAAALGLSVLVLALSLLLLEVTGITASLLGRVRGLFLNQGEVAEHQRIAAGSALVLLIAGLAPIAFKATEAAVIGIARPHFAAAVIVALHTVLAAIIGLLWPRMTALAALAVARLSRTPLEPALRTAARWLLLWLAVAALVLAVLAVTFFGTLRLLPWHPVATAVLGVALTVMAAQLARHVSAVLRIAMRVVLALFAFAGLAAMVGIGYVPDAARAALRESVGGQVGHTLAALALDFDNDGALSVLGGGDCAPFDGKRFPGAIDVPDNRIDEDCDGKDLTRGNILARPRHDWPVPVDFPRKPSIVFITVDAFAARHMRALNPDKNGRSTTPSLDALAKQGTLFSRCFAQGPSTRLSFPSMFTSRWDSQIEQRMARMHPFPLEQSETTLGEVMKEAGYETTAVVSDSYFTRARWSSLLQGFTSVVESPARGMTGGTKHNSKAVTDEAIKKLDRKSGKPLFLWAHYFDAHPPHTQPADIKRYGSSQQDIYDAELQLVDREIGRLLQAVDKTLGKDVVVIVTGDHGIGFDKPRHQRFGYGYDLSTIVLHVPLIVRGPGVKPQTLSTLASTMDIAPTIVNMARIRKRLPFEGASLVPELFTSVVQRPSRLHHQFFLQEKLWDNADPLTLVSVRTERYNMILDRKTGVHELYDYVADYEESHDLSGDSAYAEVLTTLKQQLALFIYELHAPHRTAAAQLH
jgi:arylsulfatase A-like enzyme